MYNENCKGVAVNILLDPNVAYLLLLVGTMLVLLALVTPGTGLLEVSAVVCLGLAGYAATQLNINWWALVLLGLSIVPFVYAIQRPRRAWALIVSLVGLVTGSIFLFRAEGGGPAVQPVIAAVSSIFYLGFLWIAVSKALQALHSQPVYNLDALVGKSGEARTPIHREGSVQVASEAWSAWSRKPIPAGGRIKVVSRNGFVLEVETESEQS